jgi:malate dehydrogenase (oxaloacetate-decarboxylating)(NADP+)
VISNGTAVLGLGNIGPLASKPVMEGKAVLFKKFAGIDVFDIEVDEPTSTSWSSTSSPRWSRPSAASTWRTSRRRNASRSSAAARADENPGLPRRPARHRHHRRRRGAQRAELAGKRHRRGQARLLRRRRRGARLLNLLCRWAPKRENIWVTDLQGVVYKGRTS